MGLGGGQLAAIGAAVVLALAVHSVVPGGAGVAAAVLVVLAALAGVLWVRDGEPVGWWAARFGSWVRRRGRRLDLRPTEGVPLPVKTAELFAPAVAPGRAGRLRWSRAVAVGPRPPLPDSSRPNRGTGVTGVSITSDAGGPGDGPIGVLSDGRAGTYVAVVPVGGCSFSLLDADVQAQCLEGWRRVLGTLARPGGAVTRIQLLHGSGTSDLEIPAAQGDGQDDGYRRFVEAAGRDLWHHDTWVAIAVSGRGYGRDRLRAVLRRELRLLDGQLRAADLRPGPPLDADQLANLVHGGGPGRPLATEEQWSTYRVDGGWHATYWIAEWPRLEVGPDFLGPLLVGSFPARVSIVMAPVPADQAMREVRSARTADLADAELRARAGFLPSVRRDRESEGVTRREEELANGHHEYRFSGYLTVSAGDGEALARACTDAEHAAQSAHLQLRRLYGRQAEAYTWTLPLARGLR